jgi:hypothetical protein
MMKMSLIAASALSVVLVGAGSAQGASFPAQNDQQLTQPQMKQLSRTAHTPEQYRTLANYFDKQQQSFLQQARDEKAEWARRSQNTTSISAKYPRPVDSARYLYEYYVYKASEASALSAKYNRLANPSGAGIPEQHM